MREKLQQVLYVGGVSALAAISFFAVLLLHPRSRKERTANEVRRRCEARHYEELRLSHTTLSSPSRTT